MTDRITDISSNRVRLCDRFWSTAIMETSKPAQEERASQHSATARLLPERKENPPLVGLTQTYVVFNTFNVKKLLLAIRNTRFNKQQLNEMIKPSFVWVLKKYSLFKIYHLFCILFLT